MNTENLNAAVLFYHGIMFLFLMTSGYRIVHFAQFFPSIFISFKHDFFENFP